MADGTAGALSADESADREVLLRTLEAMRFGDTDLLDERCGRADLGLHPRRGALPLLAREYAPLATRLAAAAGRLAGIPALLADARGQLVGASGRPVSRLHLETAIRQMPGIGELVDDALAAADAAPDDADVAAVLPRLRAAADAAKAALTSFTTHLTDVVLPASEGEGRLGPELFAAKLRHTLRVDLTPADLLARADTEYAAVRAEMIRLARDLWPTWLPERPLPTAASAGSQAAADDTTVRSVLDAIAADHPPRRGLLDFCRAENGGSRRSSASATSSGWRRRPPDPLDARSSCGRSAGRCSSRPGRWIAASTASSASRPCPTTGPMSSASRTARGQRTGSSGC